MVSFICAAIELTRVDPEHLLGSLQKQIKSGKKSVNRILSCRSSRCLSFEVSHTTFVSSVYSLGYQSEMRNETFELSRFISGGGEMSSIE